MPEDEPKFDIKKDVQLLRDLARWLRKHDCGAFDDETDNQDHTQELLDNIAEWLEQMNKMASFFGAI